MSSKNNFNCPMVDLTNSKLCYITKCICSYKLCDIEYTDCDHYIANTSACLDIAEEWEI